MFSTSAFITVYITSIVSVASGANEEIVFNVVFGSTTFPPNSTLNSSFTSIFSKVTFPVFLTVIVYVTLSFSLTSTFGTPSGLIVTFSPFTFVTVFVTCSPGLGSSTGVVTSASSSSPLS